MGSLRLGALAAAVLIVSSFCFLPACGGHKPPGASTVPGKINLSPATSYSLQSGTTIEFFASAQNSVNGTISPAFTYMSDNTNVVDVAPSGFACAGTWNAPSYTICTPGNMGVAQVTATALGSTSAPTLVFVHPPIDNIQISVVTPVNSTPPACPTQQALPAACMIGFNASAAKYCMSQNQTRTLQATAYSGGVDITSQVGPFTWSQVNAGVIQSTPIVTNNIYNVPTNQTTIGPGVPGQTQVIASASGAYSQPYTMETCPVQCIALQLGVSGTQGSAATNFAVDKGTAETITATAVDVQGCIVPKPPLTWVSSEPAALAVGSGAAGCGTGTTCTVSTPQAGAAVITASCSPPTCNVGYPLNPSGYTGALSIYVPEPVYPITAISGLVTGAISSPSVLTSSEDCSTNQLCEAAIYNVLSTNNLQGSAFQLPTPPNSLLYDPAGDRAYVGSEFGAFVVNPTNFGSTNNPFTQLPAAGTSLGSVVGKVLATSPNGNFAIYSDTVSTPNQVYVVNTSSTTPSSTPLSISSAIAAAFSPDGLKVFILGNGGNTLYVYSPELGLQPSISLTAPATSVVFNSTGTFALLAGGAAIGSLATYNTCDNSAVVLSPPAPLLPSAPAFLRLVPAGNIPFGGTFGTTIIPLLDTTGLDFFIGLDSTGIDVIATNSTTPLANTLCPQPVAIAHTLPPQNTQFPPFHINIGQGTFHPINFFLSPDVSHAYIVTTDHGILVYDFNTNSTVGIPLINNATPVAADAAVDASLIYVAGSDGLLHEVNTQLFVDQYQTTFSPLPNAANSFCYTGTNCAPNLVAVKP
jgi:hypothetical protein